MLGLQEFSYSLTTTSFVVCTLSILILIKNLECAAVKMILLYQFIWLLTGLISFYLAKQTANNLPLLHLHTLLEYFLISSFYLKVYSSRIIKSIILKLLLLGGALIICNSLFIQSVYTFNSYGRTLSQVLIVFYTLQFYFVKQELKQLHIPKEFIEFINAAFLIYYAGSLFIFMSSNLLINDQTSSHEVLWTINSILSFLSQLIILTGVWKLTSIQLKS